MTFNAALNFFEIGDVLYIFRMDIFIIKQFLKENLYILLTALLSSENWTKKIYFKLILLPKILFKIQNGTIFPSVNSDAD